MQFAAPDYDFPGMLAELKRLEWERAFFFLIEDADLFPGSLTNDDHKKTMLLFRSIGDHAVLNFQPIYLNLDGDYDAVKTVQDEKGKPAEAAQGDRGSPGHHAELSGHREPHAPQSGDARVGNPRDEDAGQSDPNTA